MLELLFVRHGQTDWNVERRVMGRLPVGLNSFGFKQAKRIAKYLSRSSLTAIITSPVKRAVETACEIASFHEGIEMEMDDAFAEINYGDWMDMKFEEVAAKYKELWHQYYREPLTVALPGGEVMTDVVKRVSLAVKGIRERFTEGRVAIVSHADIIKLAIMDLVEIDMRSFIRISVENGALVLVKIDPEFGPRLILFNSESGFGKDI